MIASILHGIPDSWTRLASCVVRLPLEETYHPSDDRVEEVGEILDALVALFLDSDREALHMWVLFYYLQKLDLVIGFVFL